MGHLISNTLNYLHDFPIIVTRWWKSSINKSLLYVLFKHWSFTSCLLQIIWNESSGVAVPSWWESYSSAWCSAWLAHEEWKESRVDASEKFTATIAMATSFIATYFYVLRLLSFLSSIALSSICAGCKRSLVTILVLPSHIILIVASSKFAAKTLAKILETCTGNSYWSCIKWPTEVPGQSSNIITVFSLSFLTPSEDCCSWITSTGLRDFVAGGCLG